MSAAGSSLYYISVFLSSILPGLLEPALGLAGMFLVFAAISGVFFGITFFLVPETRGKTYQEFISEQTIKKTFPYWLPELDVNDDHICTKL